MLSQALVRMLATRHKSVLCPGDRFGIQWCALGLKELIITRNCFDTVVSWYISPYPPQLYLVYELLF